MTTREGELVRRTTLLASLMVVCIALMGCVHADGPYNQPSQEKLRLKSLAPQTYTVQVANEPEFTVGADGRVVVDIPRLERGHKTYLLGSKVGESSAEDVTAVCVKKAGRTIRKLSINDLKKLPTDSEGYRVLKVE
jgi:hypothetical protein